MFLSPFPPNRLILPILLVALIAALPPPRAKADDAAVAQWREDEYTRMRRPESAEELAARIEQQNAEVNPNPTDYHAPSLFRLGLDRVEAESELEAEQAAYYADGGRIRVTSEDFLDYDEESNLIYSHARTTVYYAGYVLKADKLAIDVRLRDAQAEGNVELRLNGDTITAERLRFNFDRQEGVAHDVEGKMNAVFFRGSKDKTKERPAFKRVDAQTSIFRDTSITGCDFDIPHYRVRAREFVLVEQDRIFAKSAMLYIWEVPVAFLPAYTRSIGEASPWSFIVGYGSRVGLAVRTTYDIYYKDYWEGGDSEKGVERRSFAKTTLVYDYLSKRGHGVGLNADYDFSFDRHRGKLRLYGIKDEERHIETFDGKEEKDEFRYRATWGHRSNITDDLRLQVDVDWISDPDLHYDVLDFFQQVETGRVPERRAGIALSLVKEAWLARIMVGIKDRIGRNRLTNFSNYGDDDKDFDEDFDSEGRAMPGMEEATSDDDDDGLPTTRWGRVSERKPQITIATRWLKPTRAPLYYHLDLNIINNLDKGLNTHDDGDDAYVTGFDLYQALMLALDFGDRSTLVTKAGIGFGTLERDDDEYGYDFTTAIETPTGMFLDGVTFSDPGSETFLVGRDEYSLSDYDENFYYADFETVWTTRFTDSLMGSIRYFIREGTDDSLGEWYRRIGNRLSRSDLYDYRVNKHEITGGLYYTLLRPDLTASLEGGYNLRSKGEMAAGETLYYARLNTNYNSPRDVVRVNTGIGYYMTQRYHPSDENAYEGALVAGYGSIEYFPVSERFWAKLSGYVFDNLDDDPSREEETEEDDDNYDENETDYDITGLLGAKIGKKWKGEIKATYDGRYEEFDHIAAVLTRDMHDAIFGLSVGARKSREYDEEENKEDSEWDEISVRASLTLKRMSQDNSLTQGQGQVTTMQDERRRASYE